MSRAPCGVWRGSRSCSTRSGNYGTSDAAFAELRKLDSVGIAYQFAEIHAYRGEIDPAFEWLERAEATHDSGLTDAIANPLMRSLRSDPHWAAFLARVRLD